MNDAGRPLTDEELQRQLNRRVSFAPLTPDDRTNLMREARLRLSAPVRPSFGPRALGWIAAIAAVVVLALITVPLLAGPAATPTPAPTPTAAPTGMIGTNGVTLEQAVAIAQTHVPEGAELWSYAPGRPEFVMQKIFGPGRFDRPPKGATAYDLIWAVAFKVGDHMTTVYIGLYSGAWLENRDLLGPLPAQHRSDIVFEEPLVHVTNGTTLELDVSVNGESAGIARPQRDTEIDPRGFGQSPWHVVVRTVAGRQLVAIDVTPESIYHTSGDYPHSSVGQADRVDLSCGRLTLWVGSMPSGPMPPASFPAHDCDP